MKYNYKDLGLVNTKEMFAKANREGYSVPAFNFNNLEQLQAIVEACVEMGSPVILQVSTGARKYIGKEMLPFLAKAATAYVKATGSDIPIALHLDHGPSFEACKDCIEYGFSSVMIDASHHSFDENIELSKKVAEFAHQNDVTVEAELGVLAGVEDDVVAEETIYTQPDEVEEFVNRTGVDSLAIAIGTSHGAHKFKPGDDPKIRLDILKEIEKRIPGFPIVLHGSSSVPQQFVKKIIQYGGAMKDAIGIPDEQLLLSSKSAVAKINVDTDGRLAFTAGVREVLANNPGEFDPRKYAGKAKEYMKEYYKSKIIDVFGSQDAYKRGVEVK
ncbi:class II fructose-bisphosphate aldolase [Streptobacillus moniliformis]|uniref:Fructose-1,6-bisphosphate aldolase, class II n=2 Tax=Streptobacillus moniliformis TaxID=34105 RepID=D1AW57_STRM9|nr:class II fructose-bisphosphate aldolase [Streptobacillus moniliformis]ACZ00533.1 fructose-1,6-bisphosphate aldolase, class II [Streptobacillus moniliformis DSM 12112]AVL43050.1 fructose-1,6-bisphosphate aldolase, class II [Streptobacillus moniliformis]QXW65301.1 class II fructose-1,6-bisphosphate aldolase [Streptobacillus moniliformis]SQA12821.1 Fructose-bisphosphate aldolase [Streptobacillus moniliformis]